MMEGELLYFTPAEFVVMMELAGEKPYSMMFIAESEIDDAALTQAFATLFQRELILQKGTGFIHSAKGQLFGELRQAQFVVMISADYTHGYTAGCYVADKALWLVECTDTVLAKQFRVQKIERGSIEQWFLSKEIFRRPVLREENVEELFRELWEELDVPAGEQLLKLELYHNGGDLICTYELLAADKYDMIVRRDTEGCKADIYTAEAMSRMLAECFRKDWHDHS